VHGARSPLARAARAALAAGTSEQATS
jgi:hypothetical protein